MPGSGIINTGPRPSMDQAEEQECTNNRSQEEEDGLKDWRNIDSTVPVLLRKWSNQYLSQGLENTSPS